MSHRKRARRRWRQEQLMRAALADAASNVRYSIRYALSRDAGTFAREMIGEGVERLIEGILQMQS